MEHFRFLVILSLSGLAMALQLINPCNAAQAQPQAIYDTDGHELTSHNMYNIMPVDRNLSDQCVYVSSLRDPRCRMRAILTPCKKFGRNPDGYVSIKLAEGSSSSSKEASPRLSTDVVIEFRGVVTWCMHRLQWYAHGGITNQTHVTVGRPEGMEGCEAPAGTCKKSFMFRVEKHGTGYKLTSCFHAPCRDLVLFDYNGHRWLTIEKDGREPLVVVFKKFHLASLPPANPPKLG
ncbi:alpha-amylase/subtilisin inhibitor-like [Triticum dicoccoides]|uniref:alpha-amylase/subtilisin inhibitor-like n=1 Tax=Triticum dicoccoides TaxID=85692 RepID=UPI000E7CC5BB|nr:alpha-amylase/subtilisin inhibitor-like [Triticum dicoccoides]